MHIAIDGLRLLGQRLGVGRYLEYLFRNWDADAPVDDRFTVVVPEPVHDLGLSDRFSLDVLPSRLGGYPWETLVMARRARRADVLFGPAYRLPLAYRGPKVVAIHSVNEVQPGAHAWSYRFTHEAVNRASARAADKVVVPSETVAGDIQSAYGIDEAKLAVVPQGADEAFQPLDDPETASAVRRRWFGDPERPYVVWVGKLSQRRNIPTLVEAFALLKARTGLPHGLLLFGPNHLGLPIAGLAESFGVADDVVQDDGVVAEHRELAAVYGAADLYVSASSYEGFSMTLVEALSCGLPVVGVDRGAVAEIARGCAVLVPDSTPDLLAEAMEQALVDEALRHDLRTKSLERARDYRWPATASLTLGVLHEVAERARV